MSHQANWTIKAVISQPHYGNYDHWALSIQQGRKAFIYEVIGQHGTFTRNVSETAEEFEDSARFKEAIELSEFADRDLQAFKQVVEATVVDNETLEWDCQDYVIEILDNLEDAGVLDEDDGEYQEQKRVLKGKRGSC